MPQVSNHGKTLTIQIRDGVHYSPPLQNRVVSSGDIKYAMERCFAASVGNGYAFSYYSDIVGAPAVPKSKVPNISGIRTPDPRTLVLKLRHPVGILANANALALPCTVPVPKSYAAKYDRGRLSRYGQHAVFTGPYMIQAYKPARSLILVRNPSWNRATDFRPAHFDKIVETNGGDPTVAGRQVLGGSAMMSGDGSPPPAIIQQYQTTPGQFAIGPSGANRYISLNTRVKPFNNVNVRRAVAAVINRQALRLTRGGPLAGAIATHFLPPGVPGFDQAGGAASSFDFYASPTGNVTLARRYMRKAGYRRGRYTGGRVFAVAENVPPASRTADVLKQELKAIGIRLRLRKVPHATMYVKYCLRPKARVALCPNMGWGKDFFDPQSMIDPVFNGRDIVPSGNVDTALVNDRRINARLKRAMRVTDSTKRAQIYGQLDKTLTGRAYYITWLWDNAIDFASADIAGVPNAFNGNAWDLTFSSLK